MKLLSRKDNPKFVNSIVPMRGIACLIVFLFHLFCVSGGYYENEILLSVFQFGKFGVHMFFVISGFVITHSFIHSSYKINFFFVFLLKRIIRIEPAYLITLLFGILYIVARNIFNNYRPFNDLDPLQIIAHIGYFIPFIEKSWINIVFWTLAIEFQFYLIFAVLYPLIKKYKWIVLLLSVPSLLSFHYYETIFSYVSIFNIGILLAFYYNGQLKPVWFIVYLSLNMLFLIYSLGFVILIFAIVVLLTVLFNIKIENKFLFFLGKISYSLYLLHTLIAFSIINIAHRFPHTIFYKLSFTLVTLGATIIASYLMYRFIEKPTMRLSKKIAYNE